jgi:CHAD domain-containing protein
VARKTRPRSLRLRRLARELRRDGREALRLARGMRSRLKALDIHDLRVLTRRLRAAVWVVRRLELRVPCGKLRRLLRCWGRALGERRTLDVARRNARRRGLDAGPLAGPRRLAGRTVRAELTADRCRRFAELLRKAVRDLLRLARSRTVAGGAPMLARDLAARRRRLRAALTAAPRGKEALHALRIEAKKTRYVLDALGARGEVLKGLQAYLGRAHDLEVLRQYLHCGAEVAQDELWAQRKALKVMREAVAEAEGELRNALMALRLE